MRSALASSSLCGLLAVTLGTAACGRTALPADGAPPVITFSNESLDVATVYAIRPGGDATRLASVAPGRTETLRLPPTLANGGTVTIVAVPMAGSRAASSGPISVGRGVRYQITLPTSQNILTVLPGSEP